MPTAAKLVAAVLFAMTGFLAAESFKPQMPEGTAFGAFSRLCQSNQTDSSFPAPSPIGWAQLYVL